MSTRWTMLAVLFLARTSMGFQFQSVGALGPLLQETSGLTLADVGLLIGLYLAPGIVVAIPGGTFAARFGDKRVVGGSLMLMALGGALAAWVPVDWAPTAGRILAGVGGVVCNVVLTKLVVDWFAGREISTAMAIFINSWPVGIALALLILPWATAIGGLGLAWGIVIGLVAVSYVLFALIYRVPPGAAEGATKIRRAPFPVPALVLAALIWAFFNCALAMVFSFGPALLTERGMDLTAAGSIVSAFMITLSIGVPVGGILADRSGRRDLVIVASLLSFVILYPAVLYLPLAALPVLFAAVGFLFGLCAGPIVGLPSGLLSPQARAFAMGCYFTIYYLWMMAMPTVAGYLAVAAGSASSVVWLAAGLSLLSVGLLWLYRPMERAVTA